jgi:hypothetical protein
MTENEKRLLDLLCDEGLRMDLNRWKSQAADAGGQLMLLSSGAAVRDAILAVRAERSDPAAVEEFRQALRFAHQSEKLAEAVGAGLPLEVRNFVRTEVYKESEESELPPAARQEAQGRIDTILDGLERDGLAEPRLPPPAPTVDEDVEVFIGGDRG